MNNNSLIIDKEVYPIEAIYSTLVPYTEENYVKLERTDADKIRITITPKFQNKVNIDEFMNELIINSDNYYRRKDTKRSREFILEKSLLHQNLGIPSKAELDELTSFESKDDTSDFIDDPEGIAIPWEQKYDNKNN